ncbi:hypothetical protein JCM24511_01472 [Saitozyma sp. JCM 24511]|nr:hypothetical protein JCM24511_01472 [Saitozyma sp. JCM 24511]
MPGSKRRALKKLLSPSSSPSQKASKSSPAQVPTPSISPTSSLVAVSGDPSIKSVQSAASLNSGQSIATDPQNYLTDQQLNADLEIEAMVDREGQIGVGKAKELDGVGSLSLEDTNLPPEVISPPQPTAQPPKPSGSPGGGMFGANLAAGFGLGPGVQGGKKKSSRQKFEERQARKKEALVNSAPPSDPAWTAQLEKERQEEIRVISDACEILGRDIFEIPPDGHCMYTAIADQLAEIGMAPAHQSTNPKFTRRTAAQYMLAHPDEFRPFLPSIGGEDAEGATTHDGIMTEKEFKRYCKNVSDTGEWGGEPEIQALSRAFQVPIHVIQRGPPTIVSHGGEDDTFGGTITPEQSHAAGARVVRISYHRRMYGLGEHYNSLRLARG